MSERTYMGEDEGVGQQRRGAPAVASKNATWSRKMGLSQKVMMDGTLKDGRGHLS